MSKTLSVSIADKVFQDLEEMTKIKSIGRSELVEEYIRAGIYADKIDQVL